MTGTAEFDAIEPMAADRPTLIEGLPGHGLVAAIAVDQLTSQLALRHQGSIHADSFPPVVTFEEGLVHDLVRVYAGTDPDLLTLKSDIALPPPAFEPVAECVLEQLAPEFDRAIFIAGAPAESEEQIGEVRGVATTESLRANLRETDITVPEEPGLVGGITGTLVRECHRSQVPAQLLIVRAHPFLPDPRAAQVLIEEALEPLVDFDIDTTALEEQADDIQQNMEQIAKQYQQMIEEQGPKQSQTVGMFQ